MYRSRLATPQNPQGFFKGILRELAHAAFWATHGKDFPYVAQKAGILAQGSASGGGATEGETSRHGARGVAAGGDAVAGVGVMGGGVARGSVSGSGPTDVDM